MEFEKSQIPVALWRVCGDSESEFVYDWFFKTIPAKNSYPNCRVGFIRGILGADEVRGKTLLAKIIADEHFDRIDDVEPYIDTLEEIGRCVKKWTGKPIVKEYEFRVESAKLNEKIVEVRSRLRASVLEWLPKTP